MQGSFTLLSYNLNSLEKSEKTIVRIGEKINLAAVILLQGSLTYFDALKSKTLHRFHSIPMSAEALAGTGYAFGDGLNRFSDPAFDPAALKRIPWQACYGITNNGHDCLYYRGFSVVKTQLDQQTEVVIINVHFDEKGKVSPQSTGTGEGKKSTSNLAAKQNQIKQLIQYIQKHHSDEAIIIGGVFDIDFNNPQERQLFTQLFLIGEKFKDVCLSLNCGKVTTQRVLFRSGQKLKLQPSAWQIKSDIDPQSTEPKHAPIFVKWNYKIKKRESNLHPDQNLTES